MLRFRLDKTAKTGTSISGRACNLRCLGCHHDYFDHSKCYRNAISNEMFATAVSRIISAYVAQEAIVRISGNGDPTIVGERELVELISLLCQIRQVKSIRITTNGVLLKEMIPALRDAGLDAVTISLNSLDPDTYSFYTGSYHLDKVLNSIETSLSVGLLTKVNVIYCKLNARELSDFMELSIRNPGLVIRFFDLIPTNKLGSRLYLPLNHLESRIEPYVREKKEVRGTYFLREYRLSGGGIVQVKTTEDNNCPNRGCPARRNCLEGCRSSIRIRLDGVLQPCGVRADNIVDLFSPEVTLAQIQDALRSGGKL